MRISSAAHIPLVFTPRKRSLAIPRLSFFAAGASKISFLFIVLFLNWLFFSMAAWERRGGNKEAERILLDLYILCIYPAQLIFECKGTKNF